MEGSKEDLFAPFIELFDQASSRNSKDMNPQHLVFSPRAPLMYDMLPNKAENLQTFRRPSEEELQSFSFTSCSVWAEEHCW